MVAERAKNAVKIPIIANGGIFTEIDAKEMIDKTGADGVMLARGAIADPFLVSKLTKKNSKYTLKSYILEHILLMKKRYPDYKATVEFRKFTPYYFKGMTGVKELKLKICQAKDTLELIDLIEKGL